MTAKRRVDGLADDPDIKALVAQLNAEDKIARFTFHDLNDAGLIRVMRKYRRAIEDGDKVKLNEHWLAAAHFVVYLRAKLRMRYGARSRYDGGTHSYDRYYRKGEFPSYELAWSMFRNRHLIPARRLP